MPNECGAAGTIDFQPDPGGWLKAFAVYKNNTDECENILEINNEIVFCRLLRRILTFVG